MKTNVNNLDHLKKGNPFKVPEGYMENLTDKIMNGLPEKEIPAKPIKISLTDRIKPWLYMAAVFAGLGLFFKAITGMEEKPSNPDLIVKTETVPSSYYSSALTEDEEYLNYIEDQYSNYLLASEINNSDSLE